MLGKINARKISITFSILHLLDLSDYNSSYFLIYSSFGLEPHPVSVYSTIYNSKNPSSIGDARKSRLLSQQRRKYWSWTALSS
jgi:hypothetical protein